MDIASRSGELSGLYAEKFRTGEAFQEIDPQGMTNEIQQLIQQAAIDPAPLIKEQSAFATDLAQLWQRFATDIFSAEAVGARHLSGKAGQALQERSLDRESCL